MQRLKLLHLFHHLLIWTWCITNGGFGWKETQFLGGTGRRQVNFSQSNQENITNLKWFLLSVILRIHKKYHQFIRIIPVVFDIFRISTILLYFIDRFNLTFVVVKPVIRYSKKDQLKKYFRFEVKISKYENLAK